MYANADRVQELHESRVSEERKQSNASSSSESRRHIPQGDMVFENACLFLCDALLTRMFSDVVKAGDSGLVIIVLKLWALAYRGNGRSKYAHEMLHLLHNLIDVWSQELRYSNSMSDMKV
jgi:hypothetical protein